MGQMTHNPLLIYFRVLCEEDIYSCRKDNQKLNYN